MMDRILYAFDQEFVRLDHRSRSLLGLLDAGTLYARPSEMAGTHAQPWRNLDRHRHGGVASSRPGVRGLPHPDGAKASAALNSLQTQLFRARIRLDSGLKAYLE